MESYETVQEDLRRAREAAANMEKQLVGKSRDMLHLKFLFDQTKAHLAQMQESITQLRNERHQFTNEAMRAQGLEAMLARVTAERDRVKSELDGILHGLAAENAGKDLRFDKRDKMIAELTLELMNLKREMDDLRRQDPGPGKAAAPESPPASTAKNAPAERIEIGDGFEGVEVVPTERIGGFRR